MNAEPTPVLIDRDAVGRCFGCGPSNDQGLRLQFLRHEDGTVETRHRTAAHHCGLDTVVHGGIQASILDEVMGVAAQLSLPEGATNRACVTAEMHLSYRAPVPMADEVVARARLVRVEGRDVHVEAAIVDAEGNELTRAVSRWRQLETQ